VLGLLLFALALESYTFVIAFRELGGWRGVAENRTNTTVLAVLLEDTVALIGILLTLLVAGVSFLLGPRPEFDAAVAISVGLMLGAMAVFLAAINRRLLIDTSDEPLDRLAADFLAKHGVAAAVTSIVLDHNHSIVFIRVDGSDTVPSNPDSRALGDALKRHAQEQVSKTIDEVYWRFPAERSASVA